MFTCVPWVSRSRELMPKRKLALFLDRLVVFPVVELEEPVRLPDGREVATIISEEGRTWRWRVVRYTPGRVADDWTELGDGRAASEQIAREDSASFREMLHLIGGIA